MTKNKANPEPLESRVLRFIERHHLVTGQHCLLVAVSGGPDSVCLLHILDRLKDELGIRLHVAHLNHQLRGAESEVDAGYVADLARRLGIPSTIEQRDVPGYKARQHISLEEAAREVRYNFLTEVAGAIGTATVAVGHNVDDHVETVLMHIIRGAGTRGLRGLQPSSRWQSSGGSLTIVRPLLEVSRQETATYCRQHQLEPRMDVSNLSLSLLRNRVRHQLLPLLQSYNPQIAQALLRTARIAGDELAFLDGECARWRDGLAWREGDTVVLDKKGFLGLSPALKRHLLRTSVERLVGNIRDIETRHIEEMMEAVTKPAGKRLSLPGGLIFAIEYDRYLLSFAPSALSPFPLLEGEYVLSIPGETVLPGWRIAASIVDPSVVEGKSEGANAPSEITTPLPLIKGKGIKGMGLINKDFTACLDLEKTGDRLLVRSRRRGDSFQLLGMGQPKKLGEFMIDAKIPQPWRQRVPIVCSPSQVVWVVGWRLDDRVKVTDTTKRVLCLEFERG